MIETMKKIMFNDQYGLTQAVLEGRKTHTRRIVDVSKLSKMQIDSLDDENSDLGILTMGNLLDDSRYKVGEEVAVAQSYSQMKVRETLSIQDKLNESFLLDKFEQSKGWGNKMFVEAKYMLHRIKITNIRIERLQDISEEDCLKEGIKRKNERYVVENEKGVCFYTNDVILAFRFLIDKICGKGTWESNPYVFVYDFILIK